MRNQFNCQYGFLVPSLKKQRWGADRFEGSLPYISPEQTGRMNRSIDYRTDLYSMGATLYELLTDRPLFVVSEPIECFHCHIPPFALARHDVSDRFQIPQRLCGRNEEVSRLLAGFERVATGGCKMVLVSGYEGIGKTCLVKELYKPITGRRGHFVSGKFDQLLDLLIGDASDATHLLLIGAYRDNEVGAGHPVNVARRLRDGIVEGFIAPIGSAYQLMELESNPDSDEIRVEFAFAHDRIHQAAFTLLDPDQRCRAHLKIGRLLQDRLPPDRQDDLLFDIANHLNLGSALIEDPKQRIALCRLNLRAGKRGKSANAYQPAFDYFQLALLLLDDDVWQADYPFALDLFSEASEAAYLNGDYGRMDELLAEG